MEYLGETGRRSWKNVGVEVVSERQAEEATSSGREKKF